ncbi:MAG: hypothetical protein JSV34_01910 [Candidatus Omnitrophota bacterium]|nr:MAG: hypothetical protein JSV34_01910 [Candidatus Omnitrophota bacterium]
MLKKTAKSTLFILGFFIILSISGNTCAEEKYKLDSQMSNMGACGDVSIYVPSVPYDLKSSPITIAMAPKSKSLEYKLTMNYLDHLSKLTKLKTFDRFTIQNDPAYQKIIDIGKAAIPALKDTITNGDMPYQVRAAAAWLIPEICDSIGKKTLDFKLAKKIAKDAVIFLKEFRDDKALPYSDDISMLMPQVDGVIYTLQEEWNIQPKKGLFG